MDATTKTSSSSSPNIQQQKPRPPPRLTLTNKQQQNSESSPTMEKPSLPPLKPILAPKPSLPPGKKPTLMAKPTVLPRTNSSDQQTSSSNTLTNTKVNDDDETNKVVVHHNQSNNLDLMKATQNGLDEKHHPYQRQHHLHHQTPTAIVKPSSSSNTSSNISQTTTTTTTSTTTTNANFTPKVYQKLKISASDLNKLRTRADLFESSSSKIDTKENYQIYDVREDEEQIAKMGEIVELLVAAGYFRARIKGLHNFDKIIGGISWAIQMCAVDLDVDLFYTDTLSIGQKIALTEKIVRVLQSMKCPLKLEPHQIQGMDCIHIFPVIQWLVKRSLETREQRAESIRTFASWQFARRFRIRDSTLDSILYADTEMTAEMIHPIKTRLRRKFLHPARDSLKSEDIRTRTTMLEYGVQGLGASQQLIGDEINRMMMSPKKKKPLPPSKPSLSKHEDNDDDDERKIRSESDTQLVESLLSSMTEAIPGGGGESSSSGGVGAAGSTIKVSTAFVGSLLSSQTEEIRRLAQMEMDNNSSTAPTSTSTSTTLDIRFARKQAKLKAEIAKRSAELEQLKQSNVEQKLSTIEGKLKMIEEKLSEVSEMEANESPEVKEEKLRLTDILSVLRKQKTELKQHCRDEKRALETELVKLDGKLASRKQNTANNNIVNNETEIAAEAEIDRELREREHRHEVVKQELSTVNKRLASMQRKFDDIPTRAELAQYQKRFLELYNQLSAKHNETKKFYTLYNTLEEERMYLEKELNLINSILDNFKTAYCSSTMVKEEYLIKLEQTVESIVVLKVKVQQRATQERARRDALNQEHIELIEKQRLYINAVKAFKEECKKNEDLIAQLEARS